MTGYTAKNLASAPLADVGRRLSGQGSRHGLAPWRMSADLGNRARLLREEDNKPPPPPPPPSATASADRRYLMKRSPDAAAPDPESPHSAVYIAARRSGTNGTAATSRRQTPGA